jgi:hypothetical protein
VRRQPITDDLDGRDEAAGMAAEERVRVPGSSIASQVARDGRVPAPRRAWLPLGIGLVTVIFAVRLFHFIDRFAVDVLFWDQWDFWGGLFQGAGPWTLWRWQHGPHRQGLGGLVIALTAWLSGWNARAEVFVSGAIVLLATVAALALVRRERGRWATTDAVLPILFLSLSQYEMFAGTPNPAHGPLPLLLVMCFALGVRMARPWQGLAVLIAIDLMATHTGFGIFLGFAVPVIFAARLAGAVRRHGDLAPHAAGLALSLGSLALFFHGYVFSPAVACFQFPDPHPARYLPFLGRLFLRPLEVSGPGAVLALGIPLASVCAALAGWGCWRMFAARERAHLPEIAFALSLFSLLFAVNSAVGRVCLGDAGADASRYVPYMTPFLVAAYLVFTMRAPSTWPRATVLTAFCALLLGKEVLRTRHDVKDAAAIAAGKRHWRDCYLARSDVATCSIPFRIYPDPAATHLEEKLRFLRERHLGFFRQNVQRSTGGGRGVR